MIMKKSLVSVLLALASFAATTRVHALTLEAFCQWPETLKAVERMAKKYNYGPEYRKAKPTAIYFQKVADDPDRCVYTFVYGNVFEFVPDYQAIIYEDDYFRPYIKRIEPYKEK